MSDREVRIDGVLYVPAHQRTPDAERIMDALVEQWAGDGWRTSYPDAPTYLRVVVGDGFENGEGETLEEFVARLFSAVSE